MAHSHTCPKCGAIHTCDAMDGLCPVCVLAVVIEPPGQTVSPQFPAAAAPRVPGAMRVFGNYRLLEEIGRGGMGVIYKARQAGLDRLVAVKMILGGHFASRESVQRFQAEAQTAAKLQHPNIVALHEVGEHEGQHFFSMDFVEGRSLAELVREQPLSPTRAARYVQCIAQAIHFAHSRGILHRDLKPSNILIDADDQPRITDFGLAKQLQSDSSVTLTGQVLGSPNYMPPEQAAGRADDVGPWSDVYALGAILYQLLTGRCPFLADTVEQTLQQVRHKEPVSPRALNPVLPRDLETICLKCLEKDPQRRYRSALELDSELTRFLKHEPIHARPVSPLEKSWRWYRRRPAVASLLGAVVLLLVAIVVGSVTAAIRIKRAETLATEKLRDSYLDQARARRVSGRMGQRFESLSAISNAAALDPSADLRFQLRNEAIACLALTDARLVEPRPIAPTPRTEFIRFSPNLEHYARLDERRRISVRRAKDEVEIASLGLKGEGLTFFVDFSPDGRWLAADYSPDKLVVWDVARQQVHLQTRHGFGYCDFAANNRWLAVGSPDGNIVIYDLETGQPWKKIHGGPAYGYMRFDPAGKRLAWFNSSALAVEIHEIESDTLQRTLPQKQLVTDLSWDRPGGLLAAACEDGSGVVWDVRTGEKRFALEGHDRRMLRVRFSPSGRWIATTSWDDTTRLWDAFTGRPVLRLPGASYQLDFSEDDRTLAFTRHDDRFHLVELAQHPEFSVLPPSEKTSGPFEPAFSPDGRLLANACKLGVRFWHVPSGRALGLMREPACRSVRFAPDGASVFTSGFGGLARWPIRLGESDEPDALQIGARESLPFPKPLMQVASSADGETWAVVSRERSRAQVFALTNRSQPRSIGPHPNAQFVALSPDARWIATGPWGEKEVKVWDARSGERLGKFPAGPNATVEFSPDGQWLLTAGEEYRLWRTGSWEPGSTILLPRKNVPIGYGAFSPDSRTLAVVHGGRELHLLEVTSARALAVLETPTQSVLSVPRFSPDGTLLAAAGPNGEVCVWNLRLIRRQLANLRLDWVDTP